MRTSPASHCHANSAMLEGISLRGTDVAHATDVGAQRAEQSVPATAQTTCDVAMTLPTQGDQASPQMGGEPFSWPIPGSVAAAVELQIQLCAAAGFAGVWFATLRWDKLLSGVRRQLKLFVERHGLQHLLGDDPVMSTRRYRPQLARLLLLGRHGYLRLAKRALGHADINITRAYVRMNRYIAMELTRRDHKTRPVSQSTNSHSPRATLTTASSPRCWPSLAARAGRCCCWPPGSSASSPRGMLWT